MSLSMASPASVSSCSASPSATSASRRAAVQAMNVVMALPRMSTAL
jgi:hypothetical protein